MHAGDRLAERTPAGKVFGLQIWFLRLLAMLLVAALGGSGGSLGAATPQGVEGETLQFEVQWRLVRAGTATLRWQPKGEAEMSGTLQLMSTGLVSKLYFVQDSYEALADRAFCVSRVHLDAQEGKHHRDVVVTHQRSTATTRAVERDLLTNKVVAERSLQTDACVSDVLAGLYWLRAHPLEPGQTTEHPITDGKKYARVKVEAQEKETIKTETGTYEATRYELHVMNDVLFRRKGHLYMWLSNDARHLPVQIQLKFPFYIGTVTLSLEKIGS